MNNLFDVGCRFNKFLHNLIVISVLAIDLGIVNLSTLLILKQLYIKLINFTRICSQYFSPIFFSPNIKNGRKKLRIFSLHLIFIYFYSLIQIIFNAISNYKEIDVQFSQLFQTPKLYTLLSIFQCFLIILFLFLFNFWREPDYFYFFLSIFTQPIINFSQFRHIHVSLKNGWIRLIRTLLIIQDMTEKDDLELIHMIELSYINHQSIRIAFQLCDFVKDLV